MTWVVVLKKHKCIKGLLSSQGPNSTSLVPVVPVTGVYSALDPKAVQVYL